MFIHRRLNRDYLSNTDEEIIVEAPSTLRQTGDVKVITIPSPIAKTNSVKRYINRVLNVQLIRRNGRYILEIKLENKQ